MGDKIKIISINGVPYEKFKEEQTNEDTSYAYTSTGKKEKGKGKIRIVSINGVPYHEDKKDKGKIKIVSINGVPEEAPAQPKYQNLFKQPDLLSNTKMNWRTGETTLGTSQPESFEEEMTKPEKRDIKTDTEFKKMMLDSIKRMTEEDWKSLTPEKRQKYEELLKEYKNSRLGEITKTGITRGAIDIMQGYLWLADMLTNPNTNVVGRMPVLTKIYEGINKNIKKSEEEMSSISKFMLKETGEEQFNINLLNEEDRQKITNAQFFLNWAVYNISRQLPTIAHASLTAMGSNAFLEKLTMSHNPTGAMKIIYNITKPLLGGFAGALSEGYQTKETALALGADETTANWAGLMQTTASAFSNYYSIEKLTSVFSGKTPIKSLNFILGILSEPAQEWSEEVSEATILLKEAPEYTLNDFKEQIKQSINVIPPTMITTIMLGGVGGALNLTAKTMAERKAQEKIKSLIGKDKDLAQNYKETEHIKLDRNYIEDKTKTVLKNVFKKEDVEKETDISEKTEEELIKIIKENPTNEILLNKAMAEIENRMFYKEKTYSLKVGENVKERNEAKEAIKQINKKKKEPFYVGFNNWVSDVMSLLSITPVSMAPDKTVDIHQINKNIVDFQSALNTLQGNPYPVLIYYNQIENQARKKNISQEQIEKLIALYLENPSKYEPEMLEFTDKTTLQKLQESAFAYEGEDKKVINGAIYSLREAVGLHKKLTAVDIETANRVHNIRKVWGGSNQTLSKIMDYAILSKMFYMNLINKNSEFYPQLVYKTTEDIIPKIRYEVNKFLIEQGKENIFTSEEEKEEFINYILNDSYRLPGLKPTINPNGQETLGTDKERQKVFDDLTNDISFFEMQKRYVKECERKGQVIQYSPLKRDSILNKKNLVAMLDYLVKADKKDNYYNIIKKTLEFDEKTVEQLKILYNLKDKKEFYDFLNEITDDVAKNAEILTQKHKGIKNMVVTRKIVTILNDLMTEEQHRMYLIEFFDRLPDQTRMRYLGFKQALLFHFSKNAIKYYTLKFFENMLRTKGAFLNEAEYMSLGAKRQKQYYIIPSEIVQSFPELSHLYIHKNVLSFYNQTFARAYAHDNLRTLLKTGTSMFSFLNELIVMNSAIMYRMDFNQVAVFNPLGLIRQKGFAPQMYQFLKDPLAFNTWSQIASMTGISSNAINKQMLTGTGLLNITELMSKKHYTKFSYREVSKFQNELLNIAFGKDPANWYKYMRGAFDEIANLAFLFFDQSVKNGVTKDVFMKFVNEINKKGIEKVMAENKITEENIQDERYPFTRMAKEIAQLDEKTFRLAVILTRNYNNDKSIADILGNFGNIPQSSREFLGTFYKFFVARTTNFLAVIKKTLTVVKATPVKQFNETTQRYEYALDKDGNMIYEFSFDPTLFKYAMFAFSYFLFTNARQILNGFRLNKYRFESREPDDDLLFYYISDLYQAIGNVHSREIFLQELNKSYGGFYNYGRLIAHGLSAVLQKMKLEMLDKIFFKQLHKHDQEMNRLANAVLNASGISEITLHDWNLGDNYIVVPMDVWSSFLKMRNKEMLRGFLPTETSQLFLLKLMSELEQNGIVVFADNERKILANYNSSIQEKIKALSKKYYTDHTYIGTLLENLQDNNLDIIDLLDQYIFAQHYYYRRSGTFFDSIINKITEVTTRPEIMEVLITHSSEDRKKVYAYVASLVIADKKEGIGQTQYKRTIERVYKKLNVFENTEQELQRIERAYKESTKKNYMYLEQNIAYRFKKAYENDEDFTQVIEDISKKYIEQYGHYIRERYGATMDSTLKNILTSLFIREAQKYHQLLKRSQRQVDQQY